MNPTQSGWLIFIAAIGMMCGLMAEDIRKLMNWGEMATPAFVAQMFVHFAAVVTAFIGGKIMPEHRNPRSRTRRTDV